MNEAQKEAFEQFRDRVLERLAESLRLFLGQDVTPTAGDVELLDAGDLRLKLPESAAGLALALDGADAPVLSLLGLPFAKSLAHLARMGEIDELEALRTDSPSLDDDDLDQLRTAASFFAAAFAEEWPHGELGESADLLMIKDSAWQGGSDPLGEGAWLHVSTTFKIAELPADPVTLAVPWAVGEQLVPALASPEQASAGTAEATDSPAPGESKVEPATFTDVTTTTVTAGTTSTPSPRQSAHVRQTTVDVGTPIVCVASDAVAAHIAAHVDGAAVERLNSIEELAAAAGVGQHSPLLVIATIATDSEEDIRALARLKRDHVLRGTPIMVLLEHPVKRTVLMCGRLGLVNVLPATVDPEVVWRRLAPWIRRESEA